MSFIKDGILNIDTSIDPRIQPNSSGGVPVQEISVFWTGSYPNLCSGEWQIKINGIHIQDTENLDKAGNVEYGSFLREDFGTFRTYDTWHFEDWDDVWETYEEGLGFDEWLLSDKFKKLNELFISNNFFLSRENLELLYNKINSYDWRNNSCGGCI